MPLCDDYVRHICPKLLKPPYVCNGCQDRNKCRLEKRFYRAKEADNRYRKTLSVSRAGVNITEEEIKHLDGIVSPLLLKGQSIRHIFNNHPDEIMISDKTLYSYVNNSLFTARNIDMPRTVRMSPRKNKSKTLKVDKDCRKGRTYKDFVKFISEHPDSIICEKLYIELRPDIFGKIFDVLLLDNGSEFSNPEALEYDINSYSRAKFGNKSPYDIFAFHYGKKILKSLGIQKISPDEITLTPKLLKR